LINMASAASKKGRFRSFTVSCHSRMPSVVTASYLY